MENDYKKIIIDIEVNTDGKQQITQYKAALDNLRASVASLSNPFSALSGNISNLDKDMQKLTGSIDKLNKQNQALSSGGNKVKGTITELLSTFTSLSSVSNIVKEAISGAGTAMSIFEAEATAGLSVLIEFLPVIVDTISNWFKADTTLTALNKSLKDNKIVTDAVNDVHLKGAENAQQELTHLQLLRSAIQDQNGSRAEQKKLIRGLKSEYPGYFGNLSDEVILTGKATKAYDDLTKSILATAQAKAAEEMIVTNTKRQLENSNRAKPIKTELDKTEIDLAIARKKHKELYSQLPTRLDVEKRDPNDDTLNQLNEKRNDLLKQYNAIKTDSNRLRKENIDLERRVLNNFKQAGAKTLGATDNNTIPETKPGLKPAFTIYTESKGGNRSNKPNNLDESPQRHETIDSVSPIRIVIDHDLTQQPVGDFKTDLTSESNDQEVKNKKEAIQQVESFSRQSAVKMATDELIILKNSIRQQSDVKIAALEKDKAAELSNKSLTSAQKLAIENKYKKQEAAVKVKAFKDEQKMSIAQAIVNGALAMTKTAANTGFPLTFAFEPIVVAQTALEIAKIASQKPPAYARGGLHYQSDGRGGVLPGYSRTDNTNAWLRSGEGVVVSEAMQVPWARNLVSAINVGFGGRDFSMTNPGRGYAVGGIFTDGGDANRYYSQPVNDQKNLANTIAYQMINNFPPVYVDVKDINNQQNILAQTINRVNL